MSDLRVILHLDMDAFFASIEQRDEPSLRGKPVIVGGAPNQRGVVSAASYEARKFGVRSAMPSSTAARLCPRGVFIRPRIDVYRDESREIMAILAESGATIEKMSIDEAYLELTDPLRVSHPNLEHDSLLEQALPIARGFKERIKNERRLTASIGIAANKFLAKMASDMQKPDGLTLVREADKVALLRPLPIRAIHGVGQATEKILHDAGINTIADLQDTQRDLRSLVGSWAAKLREFAFGRDDRPLELGDEIKSISAEETFQQDTADRPLLRKCLWEQAREIAGRLKRKRLAASTVQVKVRYADFTTLTRQISVEDSLDDARQIYRLGCYLLAREKLVHRPLRLLGLGVAGLSDAGSRQLVLFKE